MRRYFSLVYWQFDIFCEWFLSFAYFSIGVLALYYLF